MNSDSMNGDPANPTQELSLDESRELLADVRSVTRGTSQAELYEFAGLVSQVLDLHDPAGGDDGSMTFLTKSLEEIRSVIGSDASNSERMDALRAEAMERWGEHLMLSDDTEFMSASAHHLDGWDESEDDEIESDVEVIAPSAEEIRSLISQLGNTSDDSSPGSEITTSPAMASPLPRPHAATSGMDEPPRNQQESTVSIDALDPELREAFLDDASSCVSSMEDALLRLESVPTDADSLNQICRELHTLKGASASVGLSGLADQLHRLEDSLRDDHAAGRAPSIDSLLKSVDSIRGQISQSNASQAPGHAQRPAMTPGNADGAASNSVAASCEAFSDGPADDESVRVKSSQLNRLMDMLAELVMLRNRRETELTDLQEVYHELIGSVSKMRMISNEGQTQTVASSSLQLSEIANDVLEVAQHVRDCARPVADGNTAVSQFIRQFRQELVELRRTPISGLFRRLQRVVRDAAQAESKDVRLELLGEDAGIERSLQQRLYEPLLHIVRNSVCHGIESADERSRSGKDPFGTITLEAKSGPDLLVIEIRDDGRGLDYDAIRRRGVESGLLAVEHAASREELAQLIFQPGFSTRQTTNQVAGRGVGMDVVASTLRRMRGWLEVDSEPQQGTRIRLSFPLPSVIQHAMVFRSAGQLFALPMQSVQSAGEIDRDSCCLVFSELLGTRPGASAVSHQGIVLACDVPASSPIGDSARVTLVVDEIVGPEEVVVRPLPAVLRQHPFCSGATLSGMGQTVLFLDARRVVESQSRRLHQLDSSIDPQSLASQSSEDKEGPAIRARVLVVDDSLSARKRVVRSLQRYPVEVVEAPDGRAALTLLKTQTFAAVFSDMEMPHVSGMELLAEINSSDRLKSPSVVVISSRGESEFTDRAKELGAHDYLIKPLSDEALDRTLAGMPELNHLIQDRTTQFQSNGDNR